MAAIEQETARTHDGASRPAADAGERREEQDVRLPGRNDADRGAVRRRATAALAAAAVAAAVGIGLVVTADRDAGPDRTTPPVAGDRVIATTASPTRVLETAAFLVAGRPVPGEGDVRHLRFRNYTDEGHPVYEVFINADGTARVGGQGGPFENTDGYLTSAQIRALPTDPASLRPAMESLAGQTGLGSPGEAAERAVFRLGVDLLADPGAGPELKGAVYGVLASLDADAVTVAAVGATEDPTGRPGVGLRFTFEEGLVEDLVIDARTGALLSDLSQLADGTPFGGRAYLEQDLVTEGPSASA